MAAKIQHITHPDYDQSRTIWEKYRLVSGGGDEFLKKYLYKFSTDERDDDFLRRRKMTPISAHAKAALMDIKNSIYQRMVDIRRDGGPRSYKTAMLGEFGGVDQRSMTLNSFIGMNVLPDLLSISKVGVLVDRDVFEGTPTEMEARTRPPYLSTYPAEDIRSWSFDCNGNLVSLLLRAHVLQTDDEFGLTTKRVEVFRHYQRVPEGVAYQQFSAVLNDNKKIVYMPDIAGILDIDRIPFVIFQLPHSLLEDVANHQIALLNMGSADVDYAIRINFPFYTEQVDPMVQLMQSRANQQIQHDADQDVSDPDEREFKRKADEARKVRTGLSRGRTYPKGLERPDFIAPPTEPLQISIEKEKQLVDEIRQLINLSLASIAQTASSVESKDYDNRGLEAGLSWIGQELERGERELGIIWAKFESSQDYPKINYPHNYSLKSDDKRLELAGNIMKLMPKFPSKAVQREMVKEASMLIIGHKASPSILSMVQDEINDSQILAIDPDVIRDDAEAGFVGTKLASQSRGYPEGEAERAKADHAERLARIQAAQTSNTMPDMMPDKQSGKDEKTISQTSDMSDDSSKKVRGDAK